jgi:hypothetical protein
MNNIEYQVSISKDMLDNISNHNDYILNSLYNYFGSINNIQPQKEMIRMIPILSGNSILSIRVIDWFVTNYSKKKNIVYPLIEKNGLITSYFNVYLDYKSQLKGYKKKLFDPFCRKRRIPFYYTVDKCLITTIGQLNFFKWALSNKIIDYVEANLDIINNDMNNTIKYKLNSLSEDSLSTKSNLNDNSDGSSSEKKRHELSENASKSINCFKMKVLLDIN